MNIFTEGFKSEMLVGFFFYLLGLGTDFVFGRRILNGLARPGLYSMFRYGFFLFIEMFWVSWTVFQAYLEHGHRGFTNGFLFATMLFSLPLWLIAIRNNLVSLRDGVEIFRVFRELEGKLAIKRAFFDEKQELIKHSERLLNHLNLQLSDLEEHRSEKGALLQRLEGMRASDIDFQAEQVRIEAERSAFILERQGNEAQLKQLQIEQSKLSIDIRDTEKAFKDFVQTLIDNEKKERKGLMGW